MTHKGCGGALAEDWSKTYEYDDDAGCVSTVPAIRCERCGAEILGDAEIVLPEEMAQS